ncbi:hypothetical protein [Bifidobacterium samirii]|uniref:Uncharacterized protein n=1 Tax=Bifidobacterium samirii TaxID=2306974 RepID=A0A430FJQ2_9BIFI|nr:hypothetical protein [Bifidobacterium samirii]RSX53030.1 hypothetical protein D2E24_1701 [Bifidobacterium samirii]
MVPAVGRRPKILILLHLWAEHRPALQYDWHRAWGGPLDPGRTPAYTAWPMLKEILKDHSSHAWAALARYSYVPDTAELLVHAANQGQSGSRTTPAWLRPGPFDRPGSGPARPHDKALQDKLRRRLGIDTGPKED